LPYRFTGKEQDEETGFYYYGARYLDPRTSRWISGDPALGEYIPGAPVNDEVRKQNQNLPGGGGIFNLVNLHVYHYAGNNPVKYTDPDGKTSVNNQTSNYILVRDEQGKYHAIAPDDAFISLDSIDGIIFYDGTAFKTFDLNNLDQFVIRESESGINISRAPISELRDTIFNGGTALKNLFKAEGEKPDDYYGVHSRGDGTKVGGTDYLTDGSWFNSANEAYKTSNKKADDTSSKKNLNTMTRDEWNEALKAFKQNSPDGE
jgi:hypothetical protein